MRLRSLPLIPFACEASRGLPFGLEATVSSSLAQLLASPERRPPKMLSFFKLQRIELEATFGRFGWFVASCRRRSLFSTLLVSSWLALRAAVLRLAVSTGALPSTAALGWLVCAVLKYARPSWHRRITLETPRPLHA
jgi:hypothetical protein